jgi:copper chaperone CopZ
LERLPGVKQAEVSLEKAEARVLFDDARLTPDKIAAAVDQLGFRARILRVEPGG